MLRWATRKPKEFHARVTNKCTLSRGYQSNRSGSCTKYLGPFAKLRPCLLRSLRIAIRRQNISGKALCHEWLSPTIPTTDLLLK